MKIALVVYPGCMASGLLAFSELLEASNKLAGKTYFQCVWASTSQNPIQLSIGINNTTIPLTPEITLSDEQFDAILLPGFWADRQTFKQTMSKSHQSIVSALKQLDTKKSVWSYCTAVALVAQSGRLDNQTATSTWWLAEHLRENFTQVNWNFNQTCLFQKQGATASGVNGYLPIAEHLIESIYGKETLRRIIKLMVVARPETNTLGFQSIDFLSLKDELTKTIYRQVESTPASNLSVSWLATSVNMTQRTLARKVKASTNLSCAEFMRLIKINQASELLIYSSKTIDQISNNLGYSDDASFRRVFKKVTTHTPSQYRQLFKR